MQQLSNLNVLNYFTFVLYKSSFQSPSQRLLYIYLEKLKLKNHKNILIVYLSANMFQKNFHYIWS